MDALGGVGLGTSDAPFAVFRDAFGFVPNLFRAQSSLPRAVEAEAALTTALLLSEHALPRVQKERILLAVASAKRNAYCVTAHYQNLFVLGVRETQLVQIVADYRQANLSPADIAFLDFAVRASAGSAVDPPNGTDDESVLEAVLIAAWASFLCTLATGLGVAPDFEAIEIPAETMASWLGTDTAPTAARRPRVLAVERAADEIAPLAFLREELGRVPDLFRAQASRPDVLDAEVQAIRNVLYADDALTRRQKEQIQLAVSGRISADRETVSAADKTLLDVAMKLAVEPGGFSRADLEPLYQHGFSAEQVLEALVSTALTQFFNTLQVGLGVEPEFPATSKTMHPLGSKPRPTDKGPLEDPDAELVARVQGGDVDAFEGLMNRHSRRIYRTLVGILGNPEEARDAMQDTFLKAFQHLDRFEGRARFSTWLVSIASNTGLQLLRERKNLQSLDDMGFESDEGFRPRELRAWTDDPEQLFSKVEVRELVEGTVMKLPAKYRVVLLLRDIEQLSMEEAAAALGLGIPALKARLFRGRLMLREALAPRFALSAKGGVA